MNNMNGIISEAKRIFNTELDIKDTLDGSNRAVSFYANAKARIAEEKEKSESLKLEQASSKIVTGDELRRFFDRNYDMEHPVEEPNVQQVEEKQSQDRDEEQR